MARFLFALEANTRMIRRTFLGLLLAILAFGTPLVASGRRNPELSVVLSNSISKLDREAAIDPEAPILLADLLEKEFGTSEEELKWGMDQHLSWGEIVALAYVQATTGKSFEEMDKQGARQDFWSYAENVGMSRDKMAHWLEGFQRQVEKERNSRIFDRLRASRKVHPLPDLGSGFGLFQEALDFRHIDLPRPTKIHDVPGDLAKGDK
jgi:hypothetical protein